MLQRYKTAQHAALYLAAVHATETAQASRTGCTVGVLRLVLAVAALRGTGAAVTTSDLAAANVGEVTALRLTVAAAIRYGLLARVGARGPLTITDSGRTAVTETARAWERAARALASFAPAAPYAGQHRQKTAKLAQKGTLPGAHPA